MKWAQGSLGAVCLLVGAVWVAQGTNLLPGSGMSGQPGWAVAGAVLLLLALGIFFNLTRTRSASGGE